jgi:antitoxin PrlF
MIQSKATITSKGQLTVPSGIRRALGLAPGDRLVFELREGGAFVRKAASVSSLRGTVPPLPIDWKEARRRAWRSRGGRREPSSATRTS